MEAVSDAVMMKAGIITFHFGYNYGAVLQTYATCRTLESLGIEPIVIHYVPPHVRRYKTVFRGLGFRRGKFYKKIPARIRSILRRRAFEEFRLNDLPLSPPLHRIEEVIDLVRSMDVVMTGSDQVWNLNGMKRFDPYYYLGFLPPDGAVRRISYATCFGMEKQDQTRLKAVVPLLKNFDALSVRNQMSRRIVESASGRKAEVVADPTTLEPFAEFSRHSGDVGSAIVVYGISENELPLAAQYARGLRRRLKLPIVFIGSEFGTAFPDADVFLAAVSPKEWVERIATASFIVTDSFHGILFALKFCREFACYTAGWRSARILELLTQYGIHDRLCPDPYSESHLDVLLSPMDWSAVEAKKAVDAGTNRRFLSMALGLHQAE